MASVEISELMSVLQEIKDERNLDISMELIQNIIYTEYSCQDDRAGSKKKVQKIIDDYMKTI